MLFIYIYIYIYIYDISSLRVKIAVFKVLLTELVYFIFSEVEKSGQKKFSIEIYDKGLHSLFRQRGLKRKRLVYFFSSFSVDA